MKIALFLPRNWLASHYALFSYKQTLERMGHAVLECAFPGNVVQDVDNIRKQMPTIEELNKHDVILSTFHEYVQPWLAAVYGFEAWLKLKVPIIARFDESMDRSDLGLPARVPELKRWAQYYSFPAAQDAEKYGGQWLPFGADTTIFRTTITRPDGSEQGWKKKYEVGFIGTLYPSRKKYLDELIQHMGRGLRFYCGNVIVQDLSGIRGLESTELLAENYREIKVFVCLPAMSRLIVEKVFDIMSCGTLVLYPRLYGDAAKNLLLFKDCKEIVYYDVGQFIENAKQIRYYLDHAEERERIARAGCEVVHNGYTLEQMLWHLLAPVANSLEGFNDGKLARK